MAVTLFRDAGRLREEDWEEDEEEDDKDMIVSTPDRDREDR